MSNALLEHLHEHFELVIGLEVHCQLETQTKLFCGCPTSFGAEPNENTCPVCLGLPGALPVLNQKVVDQALALALAVGAKINQRSVFERKQYFYPDLPKGYQTSQFLTPFCEGGGISLPGGKFIPLTRIHIEEDAGKNIHAGRQSFVDLNRAGIALLEIVSEPALGSPEEAVSYLRKLHATVRFLDISKANMEEGSFRCDANVSLKPKGSRQLGTRCEIKNLNSFKNIERAIFYEALRQADILQQGQTLVQQTLQFDAASGSTRPMRTKEASEDYRYFPDPDLPAVIVSDERLDQAKSLLPELPDAFAKRLVDSYQLPLIDAEQIGADRDLARYFEQAVDASSTKQPKLIANWLLSELAREVNDRGWGYEHCPLLPAHLAGLVDAIYNGEISGKIGKSVLRDMAETGKPSNAIIEEKGLSQISDLAAIHHLAAKVVEENPEQVAQYLAGKEKVFGFFVGRVLKEGGGRLNPAMVNEAVMQLLDAKRSKA